MHGKTVLITGANCGIGLATATELARMGATVIITARNLAKGRQAVADIKKDTGVDVELIELDLASFASIRSCAQQFLTKHAHLHVLINNAGLALSERAETEDGYEYTLQVNHIGPFLLTRLLLDTLKASAPARIVNLSSAGHFGARKGMTWDDLQRTKSYGGQAYCEAKLGTIYFSKELARRYKDDGITAYAVNPRFVATGFGKDGDAKGMMKLFFALGKYWMLTPTEGAATSIWVASSAEALHYNGCYVENCAPKAPQPIAEDSAAAQRFWDLSENWIAAR